MIGIIGAMQPEVARLIDMTVGAETKRIGGTEFVCGSINGCETVIARCGIGKVFAAMCAQTMILEYSPDFIINTGVGGSLSDSLDIGDIAVSDFVVQHDMDTSAIGDPVGLISGLNIIKIPASERIVSALCRAADSLGQRYTVGTIASGDVFVADKARKERIKTDFDAVVCEMEGAAIGQVCYVSGVPFCVLRAVSDRADGSSPMDYPTFVGMASDRNAALLGELLKSKLL